MDSFAGDRSSINIATKGDRRSEHIGRMVVSTKEKMYLWENHTVGLVHSMLLSVVYGVLGLGFGNRV